MIDFHHYITQAKYYDETLTDSAIITEDNIAGLSYSLYLQHDEPDHVVTIYHGGGVNRAAGYPILAQQLSTIPGVAVCLVDIRSHGESTGERGKVESPERIWEDVDTLSGEINRRFPQARKHLLGHSSGAGMLLNYLTRYPFKQHADSLIMLAPELGPFARIAPATTITQSFAKVRKWPFIINAISGGLLFGQFPAIKLNFPASVLATTPGLVSKYSVNMANALTPRNPDKQLTELPLPTLFLAAGRDELFSAQSLADFASRYGNARLQFRLLENSTHLDCIFSAYRDVGQYLTEY
ncbi:alpha/beta hydrolase [Klebsiella sp. BIGb0407]|uniref:alpha/beta hydrolase n=1 Tax=Klebsiella sp. BIGb0407 TaxID=2940603 RepID=UPI00216989E2|nr:lysophospholipase [Klebsiella sp. BIGb0407]MCS3434373.1 alpha-beta hydrolase superfamily lysophospholipase [Klebsiella sp. BIGb0407]